VNTSASAAIDHRSRHVLAATRVERAGIRE
jgi:hypothetical protein